MRSRRKWQLLPVVMFLFTLACLFVLIGGDALAQCRGGGCNSGGCSSGQCNSRQQSVTSDDGTVQELLRQNQLLQAQVKQLTEIRQQRRDLERGLVQNESPSRDLESVGTLSDKSIVRIGSTSERLASSDGVRIQQVQLLTPLTQRAAPAPAVSADVGLGRTVQAQTNIATPRPRSSNGWRR